MGGGKAPGKPKPPGVLPVLQALLSGDDDFDVSSMAASDVDTALEAGLGPTLAYVARRFPTLGGSARADDIQAADLTARLLMADMSEAVEDTVAAANAVGCRPVLLKGCSTARRYYPEMYLRTMGDIDLLVAPDELPAVESQLRAMGFRQRPATPESTFERHHHGVPFWHQRRSVWVEVHTRPFPPTYPLGRDPRFSLEAMQAMLSPAGVGQHVARVMHHELQLVYTASRWSEMLNPQRGVFPILDAALLLRTQGAALDWDRVRNMVDRSWAATALRLMLGYLDRWRLAAVPPDVLPRLASSDPFTNRIVIGVLHRLITAFVMKGRRPGPVLTRRNLRVIWSTLLRPGPAWTKLLALPVNVAFPPDRDDRFDLSNAVRRARAAVRSNAKR